ncbi:MAG: NYN domain-containing protein [Hapalosiphonaceae cyanobacterium JJU2]|nr:MAG: NYN domain-containing protein [Hapalosiphonaceae cyanobacterium JJU2]
MIDLPKDASTALLIDADNISSSQEVELVLKQIQSHDGLVLKRAYGDWFAEKLKGWQPVLIEYEIEPIHSLPTPASGKNATDIKLVIDAMDLLHSQEVNYFCIVSSDRDFTPLVRRLKQSGRTVIGVGRKNSASILKNAYHQFINLDELRTSNVSTNSQPTLHLISGTNNSSTKTASANKQTKSKPFTKELLEIAQTAYKNVASSGGWVTVGQLEPHLKKICQQKLKQSFSCKLFGCNSLVKLVDEVGIFEWDSKQPEGTKTENKKLRLKQAA